MKHFAQTHSLTIAGGQSSPVKLIMLVGKSARTPRPCHWIRLTGSDLRQAIATGHAALQGPFDMVVALAGADIPEQTLTGQMTRELATVGVYPSSLTAYSAPKPQETGFSLHERVRQLFRHASLLPWNRRPAGSGGAGARH